MPDRVTRHEPITTTVGGHTFEAVPLPWRKRNDVGEMLIRSYNDALGKLIAGVTDAEGNVIAIEGALFESLLDYDGLYALMYSPRDDTGTLTGLDKKQTAAFEALDFDSMIDVLAAGLTVNGLERMEHMLDPDRKKVPAIGESGEVIDPTSDGPKMESSTDS